MNQLFIPTATALIFGLAPVAHAERISYSFAGTVNAGAADLLGQTVYGVLSYDVSLATNTSTCCEIGLVAQAQSAVTLPGAPSYASAFVTLSGGTTFYTGNGTSSNYGHSEVIKEAGEEGSPGPLNRFRIESQSTDLDSAWRSIALFTSDSLGSSSMMFPDADAGLANDQIVNWLAPGANSHGLVFVGSGGAGQLAAQFTLSSISLIPEPATPALLLAGLLLLRVAVGSCHSPENTP